MIKWSEQGRLRPEDHALISRIEREGYDIGGRPPIRKKVVRHFATYNGQTVILKIIFELDGTTKTFMVPFFNNRLAIPLKSVLECLQEAAKRISEEVFGPNKTEKPSNPWLQPAI